MFYTLPRCTSVITMKNEKVKDKEWKIQKNDKPGPGQYKESMKGYEKTVETSPVVKFKTDKRKGFATIAAESKSFVPSPSQYDFKDHKEQKIWRRLTTKRH